MSFPRYPEYKVSNTDFIGQVPAHWKLKRLKHCAEVFPSNVDKKSVDGQVPVKLCNYTDVYYNDTIGCALGFMLATATKEQAMRFEMQQGDVVFTKDSESADDIGVAAYISKRLPGVVYGYHLSIARANRAAIGEFLKQYFNSQETKSYFAVSANGLTRVGLGQYAVDNAPIALPTVEEQTQIAHFLDHETAKIDTLIHEQKRLIELLKEKRQAVISHAVTKGLDPDVPMKDSGVEWLGEVPAHWKVTHLKYAASSIVDCPHETPIYDPDGDYLVIRTADVASGRLRSKKKMYRLTEEQYQIRTRRKILNENDIVYGREGERWGHAALVPESSTYCLGQRMMQLQASRYLDPRFLMLQLNTSNIYRQGEVDTVGATSPHVNISTIRNYALTEPPIMEQSNIADFLDESIGKADRLIVQAENMATLLNERRSALISAAVTGNIDVRNWQPPADESAFDEEVQQAGMEAKA
jgi:type I restriction enzyme S subunit